jgi:hypothetical protein
MQITTNSPPKHHVWDTVFRKYPCKNATSPAPEKSALRQIFFAESDSSVTPNDPRICRYLSSTAEKISRPHIPISAANKTNPKV